MTITRSAMKFLPPSIEGGQPGFADTSQPQPCYKPVFTERTPSLRRLVAPSHQRRKVGRQLAAVAHYATRSRYRGTVSRVSSAREPRTRLVPGSCSVDLGGQ